MEMQDQVLLVQLMVVELLLILVQMNLMVVYSQLI
jgi:hypothetical protein